MNQSESAEPRTIKQQQPIKILIANAKGGCGKTTLATNLASLYASRGDATVLIDYDPQGSSTQWISSRPDNQAKIHNIAAYRRTPGQITRTWQLRSLPEQTTHIIMDTPAGLNGAMLNDMIREADIILIPVTPSAIDIRATTAFIRDVLLSPAFRSSPKKIAALANRAKQNTLGYEKLRLFLNSLKIPFIATLRDTQYYIRSSEYGMGILDMNRPHARDKQEWQVLLKWLDTHIDKILSQS